MFSGKSKLLPPSSYSKTQNPKYKKQQHGLLKHTNPHGPQPGKSHSHTLTLLGVCGKAHTTASWKDEPKLNQTCLIET